MGKFTAATKTHQQGSGKLQQVLWVPV